MPPLTVPRTGSCQVLYKSCISSCRWAWAHTKPAYFVTSGQSWDATTYSMSNHYQWLLHYNKTNKDKEIKISTAAIEGLESSPFSGWVTSAPKIMVGMSLTNGILQLTASRSTVFLPPICTGRRVSGHYLFFECIDEK